MFLSTGKYKMVRYASHTCYKSPIHKLVRFFEQSRDNWKEKHKTSKKEVKRLENKVRYLLKSRESWKQETLELRKKIRSQVPLNDQTDEPPLKKTLK